MHTDGSVGGSNTNVLSLEGQIANGKSNLGYTDLSVVFKSGMLFKCIINFVLPLSNTGTVVRKRVFLRFSCGFCIRAHVLCNTRLTSGLCVSQKQSNLYKDLEFS